MRTKLAVHMMKVEIPLNVIDELNDHIDKVVIPANDDYSDGLVGQMIVIKGLHNSTLICLMVV